MTLSPAVQRIRRRRASERRTRQLWEAAPAIMLLALIVGIVAGSTVALVLH